MDLANIPRFKDLPLNPAHPPHSAWIWGPEDQLGTLNLITPDTVTLAMREVKRGRSFGLDLQLHLSHVPASFREPLKHEIMQIAPNTNYAKSNNIIYDPLKYHVITRKQILEIAQSSKIEFRRGDILLIRMGYTEKLASLAKEELSAVQNINRDPYVASFPGVESSLDFLEWLWDTGFAAVGGDAPGFEAFPATEMGMHETLLSGFGMPIAEMFQLQDLAQECKDQGKWTFLFVSQPLNIVGAVASPPNAVAII
ncbi:hypothetical protein H2204_000360 [Knufia peltigerae]|uniref:Cyclase n=1 Tax=Knufia peltigerae TaxID=1002370 RepID=A0AA39D2Y8_9EURO|nr:hypothetical protein H2204_000360 [Knufia peltigerae]